MAVITRRLLGLIVCLALVLGLAAIAPTAAFHFLPSSRAAEAQRLAALLELTPGAAVADVGAGNGAMAVEMARAVGPAGIAYATEVTEKKRAAISRLARDEGLPQLRVVAARERTTGLPDACCDAVYLRMVLHHIDDPVAYAPELRRALKPGGRLAIIDFSPGAFPFMSRTHGVTPEEAIGCMTPTGFRLDHRVDDWGGRLFLVLFRS